METIQFNYLKPVPELRERKRLKAFLLRMVSGEGFKLDSLQIIFCDDDYLLNMNRQFLNHDFLTDIITFHLHAPGKPLLGELYISIDRVRENAATHAVSKVEEVHRVVFHGLLHLLGYKDKLKQDQITMRTKEEFYLKRYNR